MFNVLEKYFATAVMVFPANPAKIPYALPMPDHFFTTQNFVYFQCNIGSINPHLLQQYLIPSKICARFSTS